MEMVDLRSAFRLLVLMIFVTWVEGNSKFRLSCSDLGGECVSIEDTTCTFKADAPGCDEDETCCSPNGPQNKCFSFGTDAPLITGPIVSETNSCNSEFSGTCQSECINHRIQVGDCDDGNKCCGCKPSCECLESYGFSMMNSSNIKCDGETDDTSEGTNCTCCIPDCPATPDCLSAGGRCALSCGDGEESHSSIECIKGNNAACLCCVPKKCEQKFWCKLFGGQCRGKCDQKSLVHDRHTNSCKNGCVCCKRHSLWL